MSQDITDTLVDDGIESLSQHQPLSATMEAANILGTAIGDGLVYGGRDIANSYRENKSLQPLADSLNTDLKLGNPSASLNLGVNGFDLTVQDIYGPAMQSAPQASNTSQSSRNLSNASPSAANNTTYSSANSMTQQTPGPAEQAASQAAANTQAQLQQQRGVQNGMALSNNSSSGGWEAALAQHLYANQNSPLDRAAINFFTGLDNALNSSTAVSAENFLAATAQQADAMNPVAYVGEGFTHRDPVTGLYVSTAQASLGVATSMLGLMSGDLIEAALPAAKLVGSSIAGGVGAGLGRFGLFSNSQSLDVNVSSVLNQANNLVINASSPAEIAWGYGNLSTRQTNLLTRLNRSGLSALVYKSDVNTADLAALTAATGDEFGLFTLGSRRIIIRGTDTDLNINEKLANDLLSENWTWSAHTHPGISDNVLMASGNPGDRYVLQLFNQSQSLILNSVGRQSVFDMNDNYLITNESRYNPTIGSGY